MGKEDKVTLDGVGVCVKSQSETVEFQNQPCIDVCGDQVGKRCEKGCMLRYSKGTTDEIFDRGFKLFKNVDTDGRVVDAVMISDGYNLTTLIYDKADVIKKQMEFINQFHLSKTELKVMEKFLQGHSNQDVASQLFISKATLRTHLNNIYKKLPENLKQEILSSHLGTEIRKKTQKAS
jgi:DNA-binding CsgD family transcriptional regulator